MPAKPKPYFKNLNLYALTKDVDWSDLAKQLEQCPFTPCGEQDYSRMGFAPALSDLATDLIHQVGHHILIRVKKEVRPVPADAIRREAAKKKEELIAQGETITKTMKDRLEEEAFLKLLPRAFGKLYSTKIWINTKDKFIAVGESSENKADEALCLLRKALGSLPVLPLSPRHHLVDAMTGWLKSDPALPEGFGIGCVADLQQGNTEAVRIKDSGSVQLSGITTTALADGHQCSQLNLSWQGKIGFTLHHDCRITGISMPDEYCELLSGGENHLADADTNFVLATGIMTEFVAQFRQLIQDDNLGEVAEEQITADQVRQILMMSEQAKEHGQELTRTAVMAATGLGFVGLERLISAASQELANGITFDQAPSDVDPLYAKAKAFVLESRRASTSSIQREFKIGYNRAARIIEYMEAERLISPPGHNGARDVLAPGASS